MVHNDALYVCGYGVSRWDGNSWYNYPEIPELSTVSAFSFFGDSLYAGGYYSNVYFFDGSSWHQAGDDFKPYPIIRSLLVHEDKLLVLGRFDSIGNQAFPGVAEWDGSAWQGLRGGLSGTVRDLKIWNGFLYASGSLQRSTGDGALHAFLRWNGDSWEIPDSNHVFSNVSSMYPYENGMVLSGVYDSISGFKAEGLVLWDESSGYTPLHDSSRSNPRSIVYHKGSFYGAKIYNPNVNTWEYVVFKWEQGQWQPIGDVFDGYLIDMIVYDSALVACGSFGNVGAVNTKNVARWTDQSLSLSHNENERAKLFYPNPAGDFLYLAKEVLGLKIYSLQSELLFESEVQVPIALGFLKPGIYLLEIKTTTATERRPLIKR